nr:DUF6057 family protein [uncultured Carboxylicivirga sp.]
MKKISLNSLSSIAFGLLIYLFFSLLYPFHLHYQEQYQLFLLTGDYFLSYSQLPGGFSNYLGAFITQLYFYPSLGAIFTALLLVTLQQLIWQIAKRIKANSTYFPFSFIPSILYWALLCDENYLPGGLIALALLMSFIYISTILKNEKQRLILNILFIPVLYWLIGGATVFFVLFSILTFTFQSQKRTNQSLLSIVIQVILIIGLPYLAKATLVQYPILKMWIGVDYYSFPNSLPFYTGGLLFFSSILPFILKVLPDNLSNKQWILGIQYLALIAIAVVTIKSSSDFEKEEVMAYDFYTRMRQWDKVISMADKKAPSSPLSVSCLNLALAKKGVLAENMFKYYQNGTGGLLPDFKKDFTIPMVTGEIYYQLGFINTAQRYTFEAMEALPLYQKSARSIKRLAETNLINGNTNLAFKYLKLLQQTMFYSKWASAMIKALDNPTIIKNHPEYGYLMAHKMQNDFFFSEGEKDMMLGQLFTSHDKSKMVYEYLMAYCLLKKDLNHFMQYLSLGQTVGYKHMPESFQEAFIYSWKMTSQKEPKPLPSFISKNTVNRANTFLSMMNLPNAQEALKKDYEGTYWYYLQFRN